MAFTNQDASQIIQGRQITLAIEIRVMEGVTEHWCDINRPLGMKPPTTVPGPDPGWLRLLRPFTVKRKLARSTGRFATEPVTLDLRNDDSFFNRTKGVWLVDNTGTQRFLPALKRARVRLRAVINSGDPTLSSIVLGHWYIDKRRTRGEVATVQLQPLERLLQTVSPKDVKAGDRWYRNVDVGELVRRLVEHAIPDITWEAGSPPVKVFKTPRPGYVFQAQGVTNPVLGPVMDNFGRQPEKIAGVLSFDESQIPTYVVESPFDTDVLWYATCDRSGLAKLWKYTISTGDSVLLFTGGNDYPIWFILQRTSTQLVFVQLANHYPDGMVDIYNRNATLRTINTDGTGLATLSTQGVWPCCDGWVPSFLGLGGASTIGVGSPHDDGEMLTLGFPQELQFLWSGGNYKNPVECLRSLSNASTILTSTGDASYVGFRLYDHSGWTYAYSVAQVFTAWHHTNPFPFPAQWVSRKSQLVFLRWNDSTSGWELRGWDFVAGAALTPRPITFTPTDNPFRRHQPTGWCVVSQIDDPVLPNSNDIYIATIEYRRTGSGDASNVSGTRLWKLDLDATPDPVLGYHTGAGGGLTLVYSLLPANASAEPWPTLLDFTYWPAYTPSQNPYLVGCYLERKSKSYRLFRFRIDTLVMFLNISGRNGPVSGAPFVGFREAASPLPTSNRQVLFRDCGNGALWSLLTDNTFQLVGDGRPVSEDATWEAVPKIAFVRNATTFEQSRAFGFTAPTSPLCAYPWDGNRSPAASPRGAFHMWGLGPTLTVRVPLADFRDDLVKDTDKVLEHLAQLCGPNWRYGFNTTTGAFYFKEIAATTPDLTLIPADERTCDPHSLEVPCYSVERDDQTDDDVQNQILVTPYFPEVPAVSIKAELSHRQGADFAVQVSASALVDSARRVALCCVRDGVLGDLDLTALTTFTAEWNTGLLFSWSEDAEDIITELLANAASYSTIRVRGMSPAPSGLAHERLIHGALVRAGIASWHGDFIAVGESNTGRVAGFADPDVITTQNMGSISGSVVPAGTAVRIQRTRGRGLHHNMGESRGFVMANHVSGGAVPAIANEDGIHVGDVFQVEEELCLVTDKKPLTSPFPPHTHSLTVTQGYLGTKVTVHNSGPYPLQVFVHPNNSLPRLIGGTGLSVAFDFDRREPPWKRAFKSGDRIVLEYPGTRAVPSKFNVGIAEGEDSQRQYGKRQWKIEKNPYVSTALAPHVAWDWLQETQNEKVPIVCETPLAPEISPLYVPKIKSARSFPDETANEMTFRILEIDHDFARFVTRLRLLSISAAQVESAAGAGVGEGVGIGGGP